MDLRTGDRVVNGWGGPSRISPISRFAGASFILLFAGFFLYNTLVGVGTIPQLPVGYYSLTCLVVLLGFAASGRGVLTGGTVFESGYSRWVLGFLVFGVLWTLGWLTATTAPHADEVVVQVIQTLFILLTLFLIGCHLDLSDPLLGRLARVSLVLISAFLLANFIMTGRFEFDARQQFGTEAIATYQGFATSTLVISILAVATSRKLLVQGAMLLAGILSLSMLAARSEFVGFIAAFVAFASLTTFRYRGGVFALIILCLGVGFLLFIFRDLILQTRHGQLLDLSTSTSAIERAYQTQIAVGQIERNPILGQFDGHYQAGGEGSYSHSVLSAWVLFGLPGFLMYASLLLVPLLASAFKLFIRRDYGSLWLAVLLFSTPVFLLSLAAKPVFWEVPGLMWGLFAQACQQDMRTRRSRQPGPIASRSWKEFPA